MKPITETSEPLFWLQPSALRRGWELRDRNDVIATLAWQSSFQASAVGETAEGRWSFKLEGFFRSWVTITNEAGISARFRALPSFNGILEIPDGPALSWDSNFWLTKWIWSDSDGIELVRMTRNLSLRTEGVVDWETVAIERPELPMLLLLGWYLIVQVTDIRPG